MPEKVGICSEITEMVHYSPLITIHFILMVGYVIVHFHQENLFCQCSLKLDSNVIEERWVQLLVLVYSWFTANHDALIRR